MKKKMIAMTILAISFISVTAILWFLKRVEVKKYCRKENLYERLNFEIPDGISAKELYFKIDEETMSGDERETLVLEFEITDEEMTDFIDLIENAEYVCWDSNEAIPRFESKDKNCNIDYSKIKKVYEYCFLRKTDKMNIRSKVYLYMLESEGGRRKIYVYYSG